MEFLVLLYLYLAFRAKHFACDFLFQANWMAMNKGKPGIEGYKALIPHVAIHAMGTLIVALIFAPSLWWLSIVDFFLHGFIDRIKGVIGYNKKWETNNKRFWWLFGLDQEMHNLSHILYIALIFMSLNNVSLF